MLTFSVGEVAQATGLSEHEVRHRARKIKCDIRYGVPYDAVWWILHYRKTTLKDRMRMMILKLRAKTK